jgi:hypothetical protein
MARRDAPRPRDRQGHEVDLLVDRGADRVAVQARSGRTIAPAAFDAPQLLKSHARQ